MMRRASSWDSVECVVDISVLTFVHPSFDIDSWRLALSYWQFFWFYFLVPCSLFPRTWYSSTSTHRPRVPETWWKVLHPRCCTWTHHSFCVSWQCVWSVYVSENFTDTRSSSVPLFWTLFFSHVWLQREYSQRSTRTRERIIFTYVMFERGVGEFWSFPSNTSSITH